MDKIKLFLKKLREMPDFDRVKFIFLFGSYALKKQNNLSDIDFAVFYDGNSKERFKFRLKLMAKFPDKFDIHIFQDLPLHVRMNVLKGKIIYAKDLTFAYDTAYETIKAFERFKKYYYDYLERNPITKELN